MRGGLNPEYLELDGGLAKEVNELAGTFNSQDYSQVKNIDGVLLKKDISVEKKKKILLKELHDSIVRAFSIDKGKFGKKSFDSLKKRLHNIRKIIIKLRHIDYYLETAFLQDLKFSKPGIREKKSKIQRQDNLAKNELELLEYTTYRLIEEAAMLDKRLLKEYAGRQKKVTKKAKAESESLEMLLRKESILLEHLEAKLPPPKAATISMLKEPMFTHWVARVLSLLSYLERIYLKETSIFSKLKKNKLMRIKINKRISQMIKEKSKLVDIMYEKAAYMKKFKLDDDLKKELHNFTTAITL